MILATIKVSGVRAVAVGVGAIPAGIIGAQVRIEYTDPRWDALSKTVVFRGAVTRDVLNAGELVEIPAECVELPGSVLWVGVYGTNADGIAIPTLWADLGKVRAAADPSGDPSAAPALPVWAQLQEQIDEIKQQGGRPGTPGKDGEDGGYYIPEVTQPNQDTIQFDFTPSKEGMSAVEPVRVTIPGSGGNVDLSGYLQKTELTEAVNDALAQAKASGKFDGADGQDGKDGYTPVKGVDYFDGKDGILPWNSVKSFGAVGDGETDDTTAIQNALDNGGIVYFPSGVYKVTRQLTTNVPCTIRMERIYPGSYNENTTELSSYDHPKADYPTDDTNMGYGARIETYATDGYGLLVTDGSSVDGMAIRAKEGFSGVLLKYDGSKGCRSYPSTSRFRHIKVDCDVSTIKPEALFDFCPYGNYGTVVEDVIIGSNHTRQFAKYGFRTSLAFWANSIRLRDIVVDVVAEYPFYINANGKQAKNWTISNVAVQAFPCHSNWLVPSHTNIAYINGLSALYISGCKLWDVNTDEGADNPTTVSGDVIYNGVISAAAFGNDGWFDSLDTVLKEQLRVANELNLAKLVTTVTTDATTGNHTVKLSDGKVEKSFVIPATALSDEQIANGVTQWMVDNADPKPVVGTNKLNPDECFDGTLNGGVEQASDYYWAVGYIPCQKGDTIRFYDTQTPPVARTLERYYLYDANKNALNGGSSFKPTSGAILIETDDTAYIRMIVGKSGTWGIPFADRDKCMVTINTTMGAFEPYTVTMEGGIASYIDLDAIVEKIDFTEYAKKTYVQEYAQPKGNYLTEHQSLEAYAKKTDIPNTLPASDVYAWAKASSKPTYTAQEVGALPSTYTPPNQTAEQVGADPAGTAASKVSEHNADTDAHNDIRLALQSINNRLTAFFDSDDQTLDELSEIVAYITNNKTLIESITTSKVNVADIINNLTTNVSNKPLSAAQGVVLKGLIDTLSNSLSGYQPKGDYALRSELPTVPVQSVNGKTGAVTLDAAAVGARPSSWMPSASDVGALPNTITVPSKTETWTFTLEGGSTVTKAVYVK